MNYPLLGCFLLLNLLATGCGFARKTEDVLREPVDFGYWSAVNDTLSVLREYADKTETLRLKLMQLNYINAERKKEKLPPLQFDLTASRVIMSHLSEQNRDRSFSHINQRGEFAYHRWAKTGRTEHVRENLFALFNTGKYPKEYTDQLLRMHAGVDAFLAEKPPNDGHRRALLDPQATHVGVAFLQAEDGHSFRYGELYVNHYLELSPIPTKLNGDELLKFDAKLVKGGYGPYSIFGYWMPPLQTPTRSQLFSDKPYPDGSDVIAFEKWPWDFVSYTPGDLNWKLYLQLQQVKPGILYIVIHLRDQLSTIPYHGGKATTEGTVPAAAYVVEIVNKP